MKKIYYAAAAYAALGLFSGLFYREFVKAHDYSGDTQLALLHTHLLALGMMMMLIVLALEKLFVLSNTKWFNLFFWHYNGGVMLMAVMLTVLGIRQVDGLETMPMLAGFSGLGHMLVTAGVVFLFVALKKRLQTETDRR